MTEGPKIVTPELIDPAVRDRFAGVFPRGMEVTPLNMATAYLHQIPARHLFAALRSLYPDAPWEEYEELDDASMHVYQTSIEMLDREIAEIPEEIAALKARLPAAQRERGAEWIRREKILSNGLTEVVHPSPGTLFNREYRRKGREIAARRAREAAEAAEAARLAEDDEDAD